MDGEFFACDKFNIKLTRDACGKRYERASRRAYPGMQHSEYVTSCKTCVIGELHAAGDMPDVRVTMLVQRGRAA
jgi:hypothetical protein